MHAPLPHPREPDRIQALHRLEILDTPPDARLDQVVALASRMLDVPIALISLVDAERQWFKAKVGLEADETTREVSFCGHAILGTEPLVISDAREDPRFEDNPLVTGPPGIRFYAGVPILGVERLPLGTLCIIDHRPRTLSPVDQETLRQLAEWAARELTLKDMSLALARQFTLESALQAAEARAARCLETIRSGVLLFNPDGTLGLVNPSAAAWLGCPPDAAVGLSWFDHFSPLDIRERGRALFQEVMAGRVPPPPAFEARVLSLDGSERLCSWRNSLLKDPQGRILGLISSGEDITEQRSMEEASRELAQFRQAVMEGVATSIIVTDPQGTILAFNRAAESMLGYTSAEMVGHQTPAIIHLGEEVVARAGQLGAELGREIQPGFEVFVAHAREGTPETREWTYVRKDGSRFPVTLTVSAIRDGQGQLTAFVGVATDITEGRHQAEALQASRARYKALAERVPGIIYQFQTWPDGRVAFPFISPAIRELYGIEPEAWQADPGWALDRILPEDRETYLATFQEALRSMTTFSWEGRTRTAREGEVLWIRCQSTPSLQPDGSVLWEGLVTDITPIRSREEALRESESRNRALLEALPDRVYRIRRDGIVLDARVPPGGASFLPPEEMIGRNLHDFLPEDVADRIQGAMEAALGERKMALTEYRLPIQRQLRDQEARFVPLTDGEVVAVIRDISERKAMERLRDDFVSTVNHELRTPLTAIRGALGLLRGGATGDLPPEAAGMVNLAHGNCERLARLINDILDMEKVQSGRMPFRVEPLDLGLLLTQALEAMSTFDESRGVTFVQEPLPAPIHLSLDRDRFMQVLMNLLSNAAKFSPPGEPVVVRAVVMPDRVRVEVEDRGPGIPETFRPRVFERFAQADASTTRVVGGTGLGLAIVKSLTERMGGEVGFESEPGRTVFHVTFPGIRG